MYHFTSRRHSRIWQDMELCTFKHEPFFLLRGGERGTYIIYIPLPSLNTITSPPHIPDKSFFFVSSAFPVGRTMRSSNTSCLGSAMASTIARCGHLQGLLPLIQKVYTAHRRPTVASHHIVSSSSDSANPVLCGHMEKESIHHLFSKPLWMGGRVLTLIHLQTSLNTYDHH